MQAYYSDTVESFLKISEREILGILSTEYRKYHLDLKKQQIAAWEESIKLLKINLSDLVKDNDFANSWQILFEYYIPRLRKRIDAIIISSNLIHVIEIKCMDHEYYLQGKIQVEDYCLDLRDFHSGSTNHIIIPILLAGNASEINNVFMPIYDKVQDVLFANKDNLAFILGRLYNTWKTHQANINFVEWNKSEYRPTPTIIEAAEALYARHEIKEISRSHAGAINLSKTTDAVLNAIGDAQQKNTKTICFITGVPGAGKTLAGLNIIHSRELYKDEKELGIFLSGNGPLVKILKEALARDINRRTEMSKTEAHREVSAFIQNVHNFIAEYEEGSKIPPDKIIVFDEAQRAWNAEHSYRKFGRTVSEPETILNIMNRHSDWAVIIALIGGGQEINDGEAGLSEWGRVLADKYPDWKIYISPELKKGDHSTGNLTLFTEVPSNLTIIEKDDLHLKVSLRSFRAQEVSHWVSLLLEGRSSEAKKVFNEKLLDYPVCLTRSLGVAKDWLRSRIRGTRRVGLVASSGGRRLRAYGLDVKMEIDEADWFLNDRADVRSSYYLEIPATEFAIQGLELDWVGVCWDADLRWTNTGWDFKQFKGTKWMNANREDRKRYILNKYRVLLTRAREGFIIWIPEGDLQDPTRDPIFYQSTFEYLKNCGIPTYEPPVLKIPKISLEKITID